MWQKFVFPHEAHWSDERCTGRHLMWKGSLRSDYWATACKYQRLIWWVSDITEGASAIQTHKTETLHFSALKSQRWRCRLWRPTNILSPSCPARWLNHILFKQIDVWIDHLPPLLTLLFLLLGFVDETWTMWHWNNVKFESPIIEGKK